MSCDLNVIHSVPGNSMDHSYDQFLLFGDSLTQMSCSQDGGFGFHPALQDAFIRRLDVINRGFSGYTTRNAIKILPKIVPAPEAATIQFMTIFFGANDSCVAGNYQHVPIDEFKDNLRQIILHHRVKAQSPRIIIITPPPVNEYQLEFFDPTAGYQHPSRTAGNTQKYAQAVREVGQELAISVADIWTAFMRRTAWEKGQPLPGSRDLPEDSALAELLTDGMHLSAKGYKVIFEVLMEVIKKSWPENLPESFPEVHPDWRTAPV